MRSDNRVVILTLCMVVLAGLLSAGATLWMARSQSNSYDAALKTALRDKALVYGVTTTTFMDVLGDEAITVLLAAGDTYAAKEAESTFFNHLLSSSVWLPDSSITGGYSSIVNENYSSSGEQVVSEEAILDLLQQTQATQSPSAAIDEENQVLLTSTVIPFGEEDVAFAVGVISADEEFAFFAAQRREAWRNAAITSIVIVAFVSLVGGGLGRYVSRDLTSRRKAEEALREGEAALEATLDSTADGILGIDNEWRLVYVNELFAELWGLPEDLVETKDVRRILPFAADQVDDPSAFRAQAQRLMLSTETSLETISLKDGRIFEQYTVPLMIAGNVTGRVVSIRDITDRRRMEEGLREQARRDSLTGALNHAAIIDELRSAFAATNDDAPCAVAMIDVDRLKATNDTYGHRVGDAVLIKVAGLLSRRGAVVGRYGGDEFLVVLPSADRDEAEQYCNEVVAALADARVTESETGASVSIVASIGLAIYPEDGLTVDDIVDLSDSAMYASRRQRPVGAGELSPSRTLGGERAAAMVGQIVPLLTASGTIEDKLRLVAHRLSVGAGYDAVNMDVFAQASGLPTARNTFSRVPDEVVDAWQAQQRRMEDEPILRQVESTRRALIVEDPQHDERLTEAQRAVLRAAELQSAIVVPLLWEDGMIGALSVASKRNNAFSAGDIEFLTAIATQITSVVRMATLFDELQTTSDHLAQAREEAVLLLAAAAEAHDTTTGQHLRGVRGLTEALARDLSYGEESARDLGMAAVLHDIGKIRVPESIIASTGPLAADETEVMEKHTVWGADFLAGHPGYELAAIVARSHHERWDGAGYPDGLSGEGIPEAAAIVSVADAFDAIISNRPYRAARSVDEALREIEAGSGTQFSPNVAEALVRVHRRRNLSQPAGQAIDQLAA